MVRQDLLYQYNDMATIRQVLVGMSRRVAFPNRMGEAESDLKQHYREFEKDFTLFFPLLIDHVRTHLHKMA